MIFESNFDPIGSHVDGRCSAINLLSFLSDFRSLE